jgi:tetratricopeptide (TPR) repeat protein
VTALDPDELALLEEQRDHLLASLDDLEREYAAGDMDEVDYAALKDDYTVRAADVLRAIDERHRVLQQPRTPVRRGRTLAIALGVLAFAVLAGILVARNAGQRGDNAITGSTGTMRERLATCQTVSFQDPAGGVDCYAEILDEAPEHLEALTYQGWAYVRDDRVVEGSANFDRVVELDPTYADVRVFRASVAARDEDFATAAAELDTFYANDPSAAAVQVLQTQGLERAIFFGLLDEGTAACWQQAAQGEQASSELDQAFLDTLAVCLDGVLAAAPADVDALVSRALTELGPDAEDPAAAAEFAERAVVAAPADPNALLLRASLSARADRADAATADLATLEQLPRPTLSFLIGGPEDLRAFLADLAAPSTTVTTAAPGDGAATVPNPQGG